MERNQDQQRQKQLLTPSQGIGQYLGNQGSVVQGFGKFLKQRLGLDTVSRLDTVGQCSSENREIQNVSQVQNNVFQNIGESRRQREELERLLQNRQSLRQQGFDADEEMTDPNLPSSSSQQQQYQIQQFQEPLSGPSDMGNIVQHSVQQQNQQVELQQTGRSSTSSMVADNLSQLVQNMNELTMGQSGGEYGRMRLSFEGEQDQQLLLQQQMEMEQEWLQSQQNQQQQQHQEFFYTQQQQQQTQQQLLDEQHRQQVAQEAQQLLQDYLAQLTHTSSSGMQTDFGVASSSSSSHLQLHQPALMQQFLQQQQQQQQPVAEAGASGAQQHQNIPQQQQQQQSTQLRPGNVKYEKPLTFNGKHAETENFIFSVQAYVHATQMNARDAAEFLTLYLRGDAMTWWRSYCMTNGGLTNVFQNKSFQDLLSELRKEFSDVDRQMQLRNKLFSMRQTQSVQAYVTQFRNTLIDLGTNEVTSETAKHLFLYGLKPHIRKEVFMHRPSNFADMLLLAERADQAHMADNRGILGNQQQQYNFSNQRNKNNNQNQRVFNNNRQQQGNSNVNIGNVSQYGNSNYKGPAPMVLGSLSDRPACHYCGKPGHFKRECFKLQRDLAAGAGPGRSTRGGRGSGRGRTMGLNVMSGRSDQNQQGQPDDMAEIMRLGMAAFANKQHQRQLNASGTTTGSVQNKQVAFNTYATDNDGQIKHTKN